MTRRKPPKNRASTSTGQDHDHDHDHGQDLEAHRRRGAEESLDGGWSWDVLFLGEKTISGGTVDKTEPFLPGRNMADRDLRASTRRASEPL